MGHFVHLLLRRKGRRGDEAPHQWPLDAVACYPLHLLTCTHLMTSSHSKARDDRCDGCDQEEPAPQRCLHVR